MPREIHITSRARDVPSITTDEAGNIIIRYRDAEMQFELRNISIERAIGEYDRITLSGYGTPVTTKKRKTSPMRVSRRYIRATPQNGCEKDDV